MKFKVRGVLRKMELEQHKSKQEEYVQKLKSKIDKLNENIHKDKENYNLMMVEKDILIESLMDEIEALKLAEAKREEARIAESYEEFIAGKIYRINLILNFKFIFYFSIHIENDF